jgi:glycosyltransferase involved in cell wall biosynthesis
MFVGLPSLVDHETEWDANFSDRLAALKKGRIRVAYYYDYPDASTFRYRVYNMIEALSLAQGGEGDDISASWFCFRDGSKLELVVDFADVIVFCRARYSERLNGLATRARSKGKSLLFDFDDLVIDPEYINALIRATGQKADSEDVWNYWFAYVGRLRATCDLCDRLIVTNEYLARIAAKTSGKQVSVVPNFVNKSQLDFSDKIYQAKSSGMFARDEFIHIGYFSGSPSHKKDFAIVADALVDLLRTDSRIRLRLVGYVDPSDQLKSFNDRIERFPMQDYINLQLLVGSTEINIAPLEQSEFANCKSELKYFEAAIVGTATIASPTYCFAQAIEDGRNGWLSHSGAWRDKLEVAVNSIQNSIESYAELVANAREHAYRNFSYSTQYEAIRSALLV